jgi:hypothetical protein
MRSCGDVYNPTEIHNNTPIGTFIFSGHDGEKYNITSMIQCSSSEDYNKLSHGSQLEFYTTCNNENIPILNMKICNNGTIECLSTIDNLRTNEGALVVQGGASIHKNLYIGESIKIKNNLLFDGIEKFSIIQNNTIDGFDNRTIHICGGGDIFNKRGSIITVSGVNSDFDGKICLDAGVPHGTIEMLTKNKKQFEIKENGQSIFYCDHEATSNTSGSVIINGGLGIEKNLYVNGSGIFMSANNSFMPIICPDTQLHNDNSGILLCGGGGYNDYLLRGGSITLFGNNNNLNRGSISLNTGTSIHSKIIFSTLQPNGKHETSCTIDNNGIFRIFTTKDSSEINSGSIIIDGGISIAKSMCVSSINCLNKFNLPCSNGDEFEFNNNTIGMIYYDTKKDKIRVMTQNGWKSIKYDDD